MGTPSTETLAQKVRPHLTADFDQFDDDELDVVIRAILDSFHEEVRKMVDRVPYNPHFYIKV
jgi:hypothetical protein